MSNLYSIPLAAIEGLPAFAEPLTTSLSDVFRRIGLSSISVDVAPPSILQGGTVTDPPLTLAEDLALLDYDTPDGPVGTADVFTPDPWVALASLPVAGDVITITVGLKALSEILIEIAGLNGAALVINPGEFQATLTSQAGSFTLSLTIDTALRLQSELFKPVMQVTDADGIVSFAPDNSRQYVQIGLTSTTISIGTNGNLSINTQAGLQITDPVMFGDSGIVLESADLDFNFDGAGLRPNGAPASWKGVFLQSATVRIPRLFNGAITATGLGIGSGGLYGTISATFTPVYNTGTGEFTGSGAGKLLGIPSGLKSVAISFQQGIPSASSAVAMIKLPFFDAPLEVDIGIAADGDFTIALANTATGLVTLSINNVMDIELDSLGFDVKDGELTVKLGGKLTPTFGDFNWPSFDVKELAIDSKGHVKLTGGWLDLPKQYSLDFHGFKLDITQFGFGRNDDGTKWIGMSGGVELVKGLPAGASVKGLRITANEDWSHPKISFEGVGVELEIPDVLYFKGDVAYREFNDPDPPFGEVHRFDGDITLKLEALDLEIDGTLVAGSAQGYNFFALYVDVELPTGIALGTTGIGLYGVAGLLALQMGPDKRPEDKWYGLNAGEGWYKENPVGVENLSKWKNIKGSRAFGAGVTIGTFADNGYTFNGRVLLALILPGPTIVLQGMANVLKERAKLSDEAMFRTIAVLDKPAGTLLFGVDAEYQYDQATGNLIKIQGGMEAFYNFHDPSAWHLYLGIKEPRESRIQARVLSMFDANAYFMLDAHQLAMGSWIGYQKGWNFSKLSVELEAWMENNAILSFKPAHLYGDMWMHGSVELRVFKFGAGLNVDARIEADVFEPFHLLGEFSVGIDLPRPLKNISADISMEWGPRKIPPPRPIVVKDIAIEHLKADVRWPLSVGTLVLPNYDDGSGFLLNAVTGPGDSTPPPVLSPPDEIPRVPMDCRPSISFARNVWDDALIGGVSHPLDPGWEWIGDPSRHQGAAKARYGLRSVRLDKYDGTSWTTVAAAAGGVAANPQLFGSWSATAAIGGSGPAQNKLLLWSKSGLDQFRNTGADWGGHFGQLFPNYPCFPPPEPSHVCLDFETLMLRMYYSAPFRHPDHSGVTIALTGGDQAHSSDQGGGTPSPPRSDADLVHSMDVPDKNGIGPDARSGFIAYAAPTSIADRKQVLCPMMPSGVSIAFAASTNDLRIVAAGHGPNPVQVHVQDSTGNQFGPYVLVNNVVVIPVANVMRVTMENGDRVCLAEICGTLAPPLELVDAYADIAAHNLSATSLWSGVGNVLEPYTQYRLRIETTVQTADYRYADSYNTALNQYQYAYFQTNGPPGTGPLSVPNNTNAQNFDSGLDDLTRYVEQTIPPTVPDKGQKPLSPRPIYRGYDAGVMFNENYVSLMYRMAGRDLGLLLYDRNNLPVRGADGRLVVTGNPWDKASSTALSTSGTQWTNMLNTSTCVHVDTTVVQQNETLKAAAEDQLLDPDALYEARLVPSLLHEDFGRFAVGTMAQNTGGRLGRWEISDDPAAAGGPSQWAIQAMGSTPAKRVVQTSAIAPAASDSDPVPPGTMLMLGNFAPLSASDKSQPAQWTDCRVSLYLRSALGNAIGAVFRRADPHTYYLFVMDGSVPARRLVCVNGGVASVLAQDAVPYDPNRDYHLVIEALGASLRIYMDDVPVFDVDDSAISGGGMALYCSGGAGAAFSDIQVHDFSINATPVYAFSFTTSPFMNFFHHMHSFDDGCWVSKSNMSDADFGNAVQDSALDISGVITDQEARAFDRLAADVLGQKALQEAERVEIVKIERAGEIAALLVRGPQPFGFVRNSCVLSHTAVETPTAISPMQAKLVNATIGVASVTDESITLLIREAVDLSGYRIEKRDYSAIIGAGGDIPLESLDDIAGRWHLIFVFPPGTEQPDGTLAVIHSGGADTAPQPELRTVPYFRAQPGDPGLLVLNESAVDLRLVAPDGEIIHARRFLKDGDYSSLTNCRLLRKRDETAFVILPSSTPVQFFAVGSYRLRMQYRRDNTAVDPASIILSEAGDKAPEFATLEFAWDPFVK